MSVVLGRCSNNDDITVNLLNGPLAVVGANRRKRVEFIKEVRSQIDVGVTLISPQSISYVAEVEFLGDENATLEGTRFIRNLVLLNIHKEKPQERIHSVVIYDDPVIGDIGSVLEILRFAPRAGVGVVMSFKNIPEGLNKDIHMVADIDVEGNSTFFFNDQLAIQ